MVVAYQPLPEGILSFSSARLGAELGPKSNSSSVLRGRRIAGELPLEARLSPTRLLLLSQFPGFAKFPEIRHPDTINSAPCRFSVQPGSRASAP